MAQPTREEIIAEIYRLADEKGINRDVFLQTVEKESGLNPAAIGDQGQSFGLAQLYMGGGLGNTYEQQYGSRPDNPGDWRQHLAFMADQIVGGGKGLEPWHAWKGAPDAWRTGQQPSQPGRRDRGSEVARSPTPMFPTLTNAAQGQDSGLMAELMKRAQPQKTLGGLAASALGWTDQNDPNRPTTLLELGLQKAGLTGEAKKQNKIAEAADKANPYAPMTIDKQLEFKKKPKPTLMSLLNPQQTPAPGSPTTVGGSLFKFLGFG